MFKILCAMAILGVQCVYASGVIVGENFTICSDDLFENKAEAAASGYKPISLVVEELNSAIDPDVEVKYVALSLLGINSETLPRIYSDFLVKVKESVEIIDLSHNFFVNTKSSLEALKGIIEFPKLKFLNVHGTPLGLKNIWALAKYLNQKEVPLDISKKIIFMEKLYIDYAIHKVEPYGKLVTNNLLSPDWAEQHNNFYQEVKKYEYIFPGNGLVSIV